MFRQTLQLEEETFKVLASQKRLEILQLLKNRELNVNEMVAMLGLRQPNLSQHLMLLRKHHLVKVNRRGREIYYVLADNKITEAVNMIYSFLKTNHGLRGGPLNQKLFPIVTDPVCGMRLSSSEAYASHQHEGQTFYFCASGCHTKFMKRPKRYAKSGVKQ